MLGFRPTAFLAAIIATAVVLATCGTVIRMPAPLGAAGTMVRAKRARRVETIYEARAESNSDQQSTGAAVAATTAHFDLRKLLVRALSVFATACSYAPSHRSMILPILDGAPQRLALRC